MTDDDLLTVRDVAERARVTTRCVYRWLHAGDLSGVQLGGHLIRVRAADLDAFLSTPLEPRSKALA